MRIIRLIAAVAALLSPAAAFAQSTVLQGGAWTPGRVPMYSTPGAGQPVVVDSGPAGGGQSGVGLRELGITKRGTGTPPYAGGGSGPLGTSMCIFDAPITNASGYHYLCLDPNAQGGGLIAYGASGGASDLPFTLNVNGIPYTFPGAGTGDVVGPASAVSGNVACFSGTTGKLIADCGVRGTAAYTIPVGTGVTTAFTSIGPCTSGFFVGGNGAGSNPSCQGFSQGGTGAATRTWQNKGREVISLRDFGAEGDGTTDDTTAIQNAVNQAVSLGAELRVMAGLAGSTFKITSQIIVTGGLKITCDPETSFIATLIPQAPLAQAPAGGSVSAFFQFNNIANLELEVTGCTFNMNGGALAAYAGLANYWQNTPLAFTSISGTSKITLLNNRFLNLYTYSLQFYNVTADVTIRDSLFTGTVPTNFVTLSHSSFVTVGGKIEVSNNKYINSASPAPNPPVYPLASNKGINNMVFSGTTGSVLVEGNYMDYCGRDNNDVGLSGTYRLACIDFYGNSQNAVVRNNTIYNAMAQFMRLSSTWPASIYGNNVSWNASAEPFNYALSIEGVEIYRAAGGVYGAQQVNVFDNKFYSLSALAQWGVACLSYDYSSPCTDIKIFGNSFFNFAFPIAQVGVAENIQIFNNFATGPLGNQIRFVNLTSAAAYGVTQAQSFFRNISINDNKLIQTATVSTSPIYMDLRNDDGGVITAYTGTIGNIEFSRNDLFGVSNTGSALLYNGGVSVTSGTVIVQQNKLTSFSSGLNITTASLLAARENVYTTVTTPVTSASVTNYNDIALSTANVTIQGTPGGTLWNFALPANAGIAGDCLKYGTPMTWSGCVASAAAGSNTQVQFNNAGNFGASANLTWVSPVLTVGVAGSATGRLALTGATSGTVTITPQATAGTATFTLPNTSGTPAISVPALLSLSATTGAVTWSGLTQGGVLYGSSATDAAVSAAGSTGQLLRSNGTSAPSWTTATFPSTATATGAILRADGTNWAATTTSYPNTTAAGTVLVAATANTISASSTITLGASGTLGSVTFGNATSGTVTLQPVTGALGTVTLSLPAATDTLVGRATTDTLTNKTLTNPSITITSSQFFTLGPNNTTDCSTPCAAVWMQRNSDNASIDALAMGKFTLSGVATDNVLRIKNGNGGTSFTDTGGGANMAIGASGGVFIGAATGGDKGIGTLNVATTYYINNTAGCSGTPTTTTAGIATTCSSDERLKDIDGAYTLGLAALRGVKPIRYHWKGVFNEPTDVEQVGFGAQNVVKHVPAAAWLVKQADGKEWYTVSDRVMVATLVNAVKELETRLARAERRLRSPASKGKKHASPSRRVCDRRLLNGTRVCSAAIQRGRAAAARPGRAAHQDDHRRTDGRQLAAGGRG